MVRINNIHRFCFFVLAVLVSTGAIGQNKSKPDPFEKYANRKLIGYNQSNPYYIISTKEKRIEPLQVIRQLDEQTAIVKIEHAAEYYRLEQAALIMTANNEWKLSPGLAIPDNNEQLVYNIGGQDIADLESVLATYKPGLKILSVDKASASIRIKNVTSAVLKEIVALPEVVFVDRQQKPVTEIGIIGYNRGINVLSALDYNIPGANGRGITVGVKEQTMESADLDLYKRVLPSPIAAAAKTNHATVIASIIGGAGNSFYDGRGIASACTFFPSSFDNLFPDDAALLLSQKVNIQNHSYGTVVQQFYGAEALSYDAQTWENKHMLHIFSSGNKGREAAVNGPYANIAGFGNLTGNFKMAKNIITVGAIDNLGNIVAESSAGPAYDGRVLPQLVALGPNGTSDAAAMVSGVAAVMQQVYADSNGNAVAPAALIKAILYNTATDLYNKGINFKSGYGSLNAYEAVRSVQQKKYDGGIVSEGQVWTKPIVIPAATAQVKITLAWTDTLATVNNNGKALVNDLDLELVEVTSGVVYRPWVLNVAAHADSLNKTAVRGRDSLNTAEQISIALPSAGNYQVKVYGRSIVNGSVPFSLAINTDTLNSFAFTSPQHTSDVNRQETPEIFIRWKTFIANTNEKGNLYISYNNGIAWQLIQENLLLNVNQYQWAIKDTNSRAVLKMETSFGHFLSKDFIITQTVQPFPDFICGDSLRISWNKHIYTDKYKIFALTDGPYLSHILTTTDSFIVINRSQYPFKVFAVEPVLSNGIPAARSIAFDIDFQGVKCFYQNLYHELQDGNMVKLNLNISLPSYTDSILFEQVDKEGRLVKKLPGQKATDAFMYNQIVAEPGGGESYWRAKLKIKSGGFVYTEVITVSTSGVHHILFYPNPVNRSGTLQLILKQGVSFDSYLYLYDFTGRLVKQYHPIPSSINPANFSPGLLMYKLFNRSGQLLDSGKLVVQ
jgi:hypothetical protein